MTKPFRWHLDGLPRARRHAIERQARGLRDRVAPLRTLRRKRHTTQEHVAIAMRVSQASISKLETRNDMLLSTLRRYVEALGGRLHVTARFPDAVLDVEVPEP